MCGGVASSVLGSNIDNRYYSNLLDSINTPPQNINWATAAQDLKAQHGVDVWQVVATQQFGAATPTEGQDVTVLGVAGSSAYTSANHPRQST